MKLPPVTVGDWLLVVAFLLIISTGVVGNALVCYVFGYKKKSRRRSTTEWLILYLGIIDLMSSTFNPSLYIYWTVTHYRSWHFGYIGCKILPALGPIMTSASAGVLLIFALDRYLAIVSPFYGQITWKTITAALVVNIVLSVLCYTHYIYGLEYFPEDNGYCFVPDVQSLAYGVPNCLFIILRLTIFAMVFTFTNVRIFVALRKRQETSTLKELRKTRYNSTKRIMKVLLIMGIVFIVLVFPREIFYLVYNLSWLVSKNGMRFSPKVLEINSWMKVLHTANSCANVFIYSHMQTLYRKQILKLFYFLGCYKVDIAHSFFNTSMSQSAVTSPLLSGRPSIRSRLNDCQESHLDSPQPSPTPLIYEMVAQMLPNSSSSQSIKKARFMLPPEHSLLSLSLSKPPKSIFFTRAEAWKTKYIEADYPVFLWNTANTFKVYIFLNSIVVIGSVDLSDVSKL